MKPGGDPGRGSCAATAVVVCLVAVLGGTGCAARAASENLPHSPEPTLESQIARTRARSAEARPKSGLFAQTVEAWDPRLSSALTAVVFNPTATTHRLAASEYRRLGILDMAHSHLTQAVRLDPRDAAAHEGLARIWRDWGFSQLGLADALKAVQLAPASPSAANTFGTLLMAMGQVERARGWYKRALALDPGASYALNNLCYVAVMQGERDAVNRCEGAITADPASQTARNNLALAYAVRGDLAKAQSEFEQAGPAASYYNMGMVYMGQGRYRRAVEAFQKASQENPHLTLAAARARQSRELLARHGDAHGDDD